MVKKEDVMNPTRASQELARQVYLEDLRLQVEVEKRVGNGQVRPTYEDQAWTICRGGLANDRYGRNKEVVMIR
jgi:hypothetical protein